MLQIKEISKEYRTGDLVQKALDKVSVSFRDNEFVAILGPSGSGKTTLLNIIGGLDHYDTGNLVINGIETDKYKDKHWDSYRNHQVGFVFQNYYLIPHQTVLANVELALTISGVSKAERRERALDALEKVGLKEQAHKRPNQMSGGQMQRVAIARALINNPSILLADEPTGALDTKTSIQVMELLKEVAKDRLVVMVTHNPELAEEYATRIVRLKDGVITDDSNPYDGTEESIKESTEKAVSLGKSKMSLGTSLSLSFNNLRTKKGRTFLTAFAGSIGIIGIALILSISTGVNNYINDIQRETMTSYPITINEQAMDFSVFFSNDGGVDEERLEERDNRPLDRVYSNSFRLEMSNTMMNSVTTNNLTDFKHYLDDPDSEIRNYITENGIVYSYDTSFDVYAYDNEGTFFNTNPYAGGQTISSGMGTYSMSMDINTSFSEMLPGQGDDLISSVITDNYEVISGSWPTAYDEVVVVVNDHNEMELTTIYELGYLSQADYLNMTSEFVGQEEVEYEDVELSYDEIVGHKFYLYTASDSYAMNEDGYYESFRQNALKTEQHIDQALELTVVGIVRRTTDESSINSPVAYTHALTEYMISHTAESDVVVAQMENPDVNVLNGISFNPASDEEKIAEVLNYVENMTADEKRDFIMEMVVGLYGNTPEVTEAIDAMTDAELDMMFSQSISQSSDADLVGFYDQYITAGSYDENMKAFGYIDADCPTSIAIYTDSFEHKDEITRCIEEYNESVAEEDQIVYTDYIGLLLSSVTTIINTISYVLIAFVAVSLIVSSIMIGIITYISVLERTKEIGILRAIGSSKKNISQVFNAETFIIGLLAGIIGIVVTNLMLIPINIIIHNVTDNPDINAVLNVAPAIILIALSTILTLIGGVIPSKKAAKMDPVAALRTE